MSGAGSPWCPVSGMGFGAGCSSRHNNWAVSSTHPSGSCYDGWGSGHGREAGYLGLTHKPDRAWYWGTHGEGR